MTQFIELYALNESPALFGNSSRFGNTSAEIRIHGRLQSVNTAQYPMTQYAGIIKDILNGELRARNWRVNGIGVIAENTDYAAYTIDVWGSPNDNLELVKTNMLKAMQGILSGIAMPMTGTAHFLSGGTSTVPITGRRGVTFLFSGAVNYNWQTIFGSITGAIKEQLTLRNWDVVQVVNKSSAGGSVIGSYAYEISVNVPSSLSDSQALHQLRTDLSPIATITDLQIISSSNAPITGGGNTQTGTTGTQSNPSDFSLDTWLTKLGINLGFSATGALIGGAAVAGVILLIIFKKD